MSALENALAHWSHVAPLLRAPTTEAEYDALVADLDDVLDLMGDDDSDPLASLVDLMGDLVAAYDARHYQIPNARGVDVLRFLMEEHGLSQGDLPEVATQSVMSEILSGKRDLNLRQVAALAARFKLPADTFMDNDVPSEDMPARKRARRSTHSDRHEKKPGKKTTAAKRSGRKSRTRTGAAKRLKSA